MFEFANSAEMREFFAAHPAEVDRSVRILYMGSPEFAIPPLQVLHKAAWNVIGVATQPDKPVGRKQILTPPPLKEAALQLGYPVYQWENLKEDNSLQEIKELAPDLIITAAYGLIVPEAVLQVPVHGCLNLHPSLLPRFRGASPIASAILHGDKETAASIMLMDRGLDTGDIVAQCRTEINREENETDLSERLSNLSAELLAGILPFWIQGKIKPIPQSEDGIVYAHKLSREDGLLDFSQSAESLSQRIRACCPWPGTYAFCQGKKYKFIEARVVEGNNRPHGQVIRDGKRLLIACGNGLLEIIRIQLPSGKILPASECSHNFSAEHCFVNTSKTKED